MREHSLGRRGFFLDDNNVSSVLTEDIGIPTCIGVALSEELKVIMFADLERAISEEDRDFEQQVMTELNKSLSDEQLELVNELQDLMFKQAQYTKEFMLFSGVKQGISFYKAYHAI
jgi:hypothetical protein